MLPYRGMKKDIHPKYFAEAVMNCSCGSRFTVGSTVEAIKVEICSKCHPFFTGQQKFVDTARRVEKFQEREKKSASLKAERSPNSKKTKRQSKDTKKAAKAALKSALKS